MITSTDGASKIRDLDTEIADKEARLAELNTLLAPRLYEPRIDDEQLNAIRYGAQGFAELFVPVLRGHLSGLLEEIDSLRKYAAWLEQETGQSEAYKRGEKDTKKALVKLLEQRMESIRKSEWSIGGWSRQDLLQELKTIRDGLLDPKER